MKKIAATLFFLLISIGSFASEYPEPEDIVIFKKGGFACMSLDYLKEFTDHVAGKERTLAQQMLDDYRCFYSMPIKWKVLKRDIGFINHFLYLGDPKGKGFNVWTYMECVEKEK